MAVSAHPTPETLAAFARGDLPPAELSAVAEHVGTCPDCCAALRGVPDDTLGKLAREAGSPVATAPDRAGETAPPAAANDIPPDLAAHPRYKILKELGAGGMGVVYKAEDRVMKRVIALKVMAPHLTSKPGAVERFIKEVVAAAQLEHQNIVRAYDMGEAGNLHFLVMEYLEGESLDKYVARKGPLAIHLACTFARQAANGLQHAAERGLTHRDVKPQNLMVQRKGQIKVMDFGLARFVRSDDEEPAAAPGRVPFGAGKPVSDPLTNPNLIMGTPDYLSPEQARNSHAVDHRSDLYSLGCTLYFLLTGRPPFADESTLIDKLLGHTEGQPPPLRKLRPEVPEGLAAVVAKMMAKKPEDRFQTAAEVAAALSPFARADAAAHEVVEAVMVAPPAPPHPAPVPARSRAELVRESDTAPGPEGPTLVEAERPRKPKKAKKARAVPWWQRAWVLATAAAAAAALLVVVAVIAARGKKNSENPPAGDDPRSANSDNKPPAGGTPDAKGKANAGTNPFRNGGVVDGEPKPFLFVVPSEGLYGPDYFPVARALADGGLKVETVSGSGTYRLAGDPERKARPADRKLADVKAADYSGVAFAGRDVDEYVLSGPQSGAGLARRLIQEMQQQNKPVAAICVGQRVLANHDALRGKRASRSKYLLEHFPGVNGGGMTWVDERVVVAVAWEKGPPVITAGEPDDAAEFANTILKVVKGK